MYRGTGQGERRLEFIINDNRPDKIFGRFINVFLANL